MKTKLTLCLIAVLFAANTFAQDESWETYTTDQYEVKYPSDWDFKNEGIMRMDILAQAPLESDDDNLRENLNLVKEDAKELSLEDYFASSIEMLKKVFPAMEVIATEDIENEDKTMKRFTYTAKMGPEHLYFSQAYGIEDNVAYVLTFTSEYDKFENYKGIENIIFENFKLMSK